MVRKISAFLKIIGVIGSLCGIIATVFAIYAYYNPTSPSTQRYDSIVGSWLSDYSYTVKGIPLGLREKLPSSLMENTTFMAVSLLTLMLKVTIYS